MSIRFCTTPTEFQAALDNCVAGDIIRLDHTKTFLGWFTVRNRGVIPDNNRIIIESDTDPALLPQPRYRFKASDSALVAKIRQDPSQPNGQNVPTVYFEQQANGYIFRLIEIMPNIAGNGVQLAIGANDSRQTEYFQQPYNITVDRCYLHGDRLQGGKNGLIWHGKNIKIWNSRFENHFGVGQDATALGGINGEGPFELINCYVEGGGYSHITAGSDRLTRTIATVLASPAPTNTGCTVSTIKDLSVGQMVAFLYTDPVSGKLRRKHPFITAIDTATNRITYPDQGVTPDVPGDIKWGIQMHDLTIRRNHMTKKLEWKDPILGLPVPDAGTITPIGTGGVPIGQYYYAIQGILKGLGYQNNDYYSPLSAEKSINITTTSNVTFTWPTLADVNLYRIYRYQKDASGNRINMRYFETSNLSFTDNGAVGTTIGSVSQESGTKRVIKNIFEFKTGVRIQCDSNIMEYHWKGSDVGHCVWMKNNNQDGNDEFSQATDITFEWNIMRHVGAGISISGPRSSTNLMEDMPDNMRRIMIRNNLLHDSTLYWTEGAFIFAANMINGLIDCTFDHNTFIHTISGAIAVANSFPDPGFHVNPVTTNNIFVNNDYGIKGQEGPSSVYTAIGKSAMDAHSNNTWTYNKNVLGGGPSGSYNFAGSTNYFPDMVTFANQFKNYDNGINGDYRLKRISEGDAIDSLYINAGTDGKDIGCDVKQLMNRVAGVIEGLPETGDPITPPPPPPPPPTANIQAKVLNVAQPVAVGDQLIDFGFQPKVILLLYTKNTSDAEINHYGFGLGSACDDGSMWAGWTSYQHGVSPSVTNPAQRNDACVIITDTSNNIVAQATVKSWNTTGITLTWTQVLNGANVTILALSGTGLSNYKAFNQQIPMTASLQSIDVGFQPDSVILYMPVNVTGGLPHNSSKSTSMMLGFISSASEHKIAANRLRNNSTRSDNTSRFVGDGGFYTWTELADPTSIAALDSFFATGFKLNFTTVSAEANYLFGLALKGFQTKVQLFNEPVANGDVTYAPGFKPEAVVFVGDFNASSASKAADARLGIGFVADPSLQRAAIAVGAAAGTYPTVAKTLLDRTKILRQRTEAGAELSAADLKAYTASGYTLTWSGTPSGKEFLSFAIGQKSVPPIELSGTIDYDVDIVADLVTAIELQATIDYDMNINAALTGQTVIHKSVVQMFGLTINLDVKREMDSGTVNVLAADVGGTQVNFNKPFKDIDSITLTVSGTTPITPIYDFADVPNPVGFKILAFNSSGARVNATVSWKARGIV